MIHPHIGNLTVNASVAVSEPFFLPVTCYTVDKPRLVSQLDAGTIQLKKVLLRLVDIWEGFEPAVSIINYTVVYLNPSSYCRYSLRTTYLMLEIRDF